MIDSVWSSLVIACSLALTLPFFSQGLRVLSPFGEGGLISLMPEEEILKTDRVFRSNGSILLAG